VTVKLSVLEYEVVDQVARITMDHPPVNALGLPFLEDFRAVLDRLSGGREARAVVLRSACDGFFSAGDDVRDLREIDPDTLATLVEALPRAHAMLKALESLPLPTLAAINGHALGGGLELALACDLRFMGSDSGRIGLPEVRLGMIPSLGGTQRLPLVVGKGKALEMMFKGLQLTPEEAEKIGLVNAVYPKSELEERALDYAARLARQATGAIAKIKRCVNVGLYEGFERGIAEEQKAFEENITAPDVSEGVTAFLDGRKPEFQGWNPEEPPARSRKR
jgi:enoyl-CoA hydratase/carnithine racemase